MSTPVSPSDAPLSRRERERQSRREAMLDAARVVFAEKGYEAARLDEIADRAEFGKGTLYNYFEGGKVELLFAIVEHELDDVRAVIEHAIARDHASGRPVRDVLSDLIADLVDRIQRGREAFLIVTKELPRILFSSDREQALRLHEMYVRTVDALVPMLEAAMDSGAMRRIDPRAAAHLVFDNVRGVLLATVMHDGCPMSGADAIPFPDPALAADVVATVLLDGLVPDPAAPFPVLPAPSASSAA